MEEKEKERKELMEAKRMKMFDESEDVLPHEAQLRRRKIMYEQFLERKKKRKKL